MIPKETSASDDGHEKQWASSLLTHSSIGEKTKNSLPSVGFVSPGIGDPARFKEACRRVYRASSVRTRRAAKPTGNGTALGWKCPWTPTTGPFLAIIFGQRKGAIAKMLHIVAMLFFVCLCVRESLRVLLSRLLRKPVRLQRRRRENKTLPRWRRNLRGAGPQRRSRSGVLREEVTKGRQRTELEFFSQFGRCTHCWQQTSLFVTIQFW